MASHNHIHKFYKFLTDFFHIPPIIIINQIEAYIEFYHFYDSYLVKLEKEIKNKELSYNDVLIACMRLNNLF